MQQLVTIYSQMLGDIITPITKFGRQ